MARTKGSLNAETRSRRKLILEILDEIRDELPVTKRHLWYLFVSRYDGRIKNGAFMGCLNDMIDGKNPDYRVNWSMFKDESHAEDKPFFLIDPEQALMCLAEDYRTNLWAGQPRLVEVWSEKRAIYDALLPTCRAFGVRLVCCAGCASRTQKHEAWERFEKAMHAEPMRKPRVLYFGDYDPSGLRMDQDTYRQEAPDFINIDYEPLIPEGIFERVAVTREQTESQHMQACAVPADKRDPPDRTTKADPNIDWFRRQGYGDDDAWEIDALPTGDLIDLPRGRIIELIEPKAWKKAQRKSERGRRELCELRRLYAKGRST